MNNEEGGKRWYFSDMLCFGVRTVVTASSVVGALCSVHQYNVPSHNSSVGLFIASNVHGSLSPFSSRKLKFRATVAPSFLFSN
jgi:hypothetical protein